MRKLFRHILRVFLFLPFYIFLPVKVYGKKNLPKGGRYVSVSNHLTGFDVTLMWRYLPAFKYFLAKKEFQKNPFTRFFMYMLGAIFIDRHKMDLKAMKQCFASVKKAPLIIFPEGTRNRENDSLQQVKGGASMIAVKGDVPVVPVMIYARSKLFRKNYIYIAPPINLPYTSKDRFNSEALKNCTRLIESKMIEAKESLNVVVSINKKNKKG